MWTTGDGDRNALEIDYFDFGERKADIQGNNNCFWLRQLNIHCGFPGVIVEPCPICKVDHSFQTSVWVAHSRGSLAALISVWNAPFETHQRSLSRHRLVMINFFNLGSCSHLCRPQQGIGTQCGCTSPPEAAYQYLTVLYSFDADC